MKAVRRKDTAAELEVRRYLHGAGLRYVLHDHRLPGTPDIVLPRRKTVVFVHGCFWHGHDCHHGSVASKTNSEFWAKKLLANKTRDARKQLELRDAGWHLEVIWECQVKDERRLSELVHRLLRR